ncbi:tRNA-dihydrouridine(47) synthase [NAD(P)(+)]-like [Achroia grisella]|uniref:tRNA-dihydrouridine(47) synthase [NAD(P)(+)]-like n=1 Tax=Achroia grisella TaxID=688607 RepID=UPI0027D2A3E8|nr:tRNA-dihydrouridine(47) synthase [NAD(P)(+)]-like [Achroia grisella]
MTNISDGVCAIKEEYIVKRTTNIDTESSSNSIKRKLDDTGDCKDNNGDNKLSKNNNTDNIWTKHKKRGQNKARPKTFHDNKEDKPCPSIVDVKCSDEVKPCQYTNCKFIHNPSDYLTTKPKDISQKCHIFDIRGKCPRGIACRFGSEHITPEGYNLVNEEKFMKWKEDTQNTLQHTLQIQLQKRTYDLSFAEKLVKLMDTRNKSLEKTSSDLENTTTENTVDKEKKFSGTITDEDIIKLLPREKKTINWENKLYLSPLTTVGNLPFRRICKQYGADITCGEMALCESLLKGTKQEWALVKRHESEDIFGAQICGNNAYIITKVAQLLQENAHLDFIDLNLGCPIDLIYKKGGGSGMMHRLPTLQASITCASKLLNIPFTIKMRTGVYQNKKIAHTIIPKVVEAGVSMVCLHGRSREARYTRSADWEYIETCAKAAAPCPVFGNGDILNYEDYVQRREMAPSIQGVMIGRGALIKPWVFTEIKEQRLWDISSKERFEIIKKYTNYGLEHWGSDVQGVENTRRFLLEWLSFLYRYVPVGLLERPPQKINERPPTYFGRDDLETLMGSANCVDWIKISEMLLGPVPDGFKFLPKHKTNLYQ